MHHLNLDVESGASDFCRRIFLSKFPSLRVLTFQLSFSGGFFEISSTPLPFFLGSPVKPPEYLFSPQLLL